MPQRYSAQIREEFPEVDIFLGIDQYPDIVKIINKHIKYLNCYNMPGVMFNYLISRKNIDIDYVNSVFATQEDVAPVTIALCSETGIDKNETWKTLPSNMKRDVVNITVRHFQSEGYSVTSQSGRYVYQFQRSLSKACKIDEVKALQKAAITKRNTVHMPNAIEACLKLANETIKTDAKIGKGCAAIDLLPLSKTFDQSLTQENN